MEKKIAELVNKFHDLVHDHKKKIYLIIEFGKAENSNIFKTFPMVEKLKIYLKTNGKLKGEKEYYQYQYQNKIFKRIKTKKLETEVQKDLFLGSSLFHTNKNNVNVNFNYDIDYDIDYRLGIHLNEDLEIFPQHVAYHNIIYVHEEEWKIEDVSIFVKKENKKSCQIERFYIQFKLPMGTNSMGTLLNISEEISKIFKNISDSKEQNLTLDSILES